MPHRRSQLSNTTTAYPAAEKRGSERSLHRKNINLFSAKFSLSAHISRHVVFSVFRLMFFTLSINFSARLENFILHICVFLGSDGGAEMMMIPHVCGTLTFPSFHDDDYKRRENI